MPNTNNIKFACLVPVGGTNTPPAVLFYAEEAIDLFEVLATAELIVVRRHKEEWEDFDNRVRSVSEFVCAH